MKRPGFIAILALGLVTMSRLSGGNIADSGDRPVALLELFTSEGCSSCPPAERWLGTLKDSGGLWKTIVPVAFHVDYWNRLGWPDRFASPAFTARQHAYAKEWRSSSVYTPAFVLDGKEWRRGGEAPTPTRTFAGRLIVESAEEGTFRVTFRPVQEFAGGRVQVAILDCDVATKVLRGENAGRELKHDFVVIAFTESELSHQEGNWTATVKLSPKATRPALAAWVTTEGSPAPIQAAGGWLNDSTR
jgi:hypothetical protein